MGASYYLLPEQTCEFMTYGGVKMVFYSSNIEVRYWDYKGYDDACTAQDDAGEHYTSDTYLTVKKREGKWGVCSYRFEVKNTNTVGKMRFEVYRNSATILGYAVASLLAVCAFLF